MIVPAVSDDRTVLLLLPSRREMYPLSTAAFTRAQGSRRQLANDYLDALIIDQGGEVRKIERISVLGPWGDSPGRRLLSRLTDAWRIDVLLSAPLPYPFEELKRLIVDCLESPSSADSLHLDEPSERDEFVRAVRAARGVDEVVALLKLPSPEDALDVL